MSTVVGRPPIAELRHGLIALRGNWSSFVLLGIALVVLGTISLGSVVVTSLATAVVIGTLILLGGVAETAGAFWCRGWSGFFLHLLSGVLSMRRFPGRPWTERRSTPRCGADPTISRP